jgi:hypothetical protein
MAAADSNMVKTNSKIPSRQVEFLSPASLILWSHNQQKKMSNTLNFSTVADKMMSWWAAIKLNLHKLDVEAIVKADWCKGRLTGIASILIGKNGE